jgi:transcriptional regulator with XRE-family HTH domain
MDEDAMPKVKTAPSDVKTTSLQAFASQLRAWRQQAGWTQLELGREIGYSASLISGVESMDKPPTADFARACDKAFGTPGFGEETGTPGTFMTFYELVAREAYPAFFAPVVPFEREAVRIHGWELGSIPGLLQTEDYARSHMRSGRPQDSDSAIDKLVAARMERQGILAGDKFPLLWSVIDEGALRHAIGGSAVMGAQLDRLIEAASLPCIVVQVLPFRAHDNAGADGAITIYEFAEAPAVCYTECYSGGRIVEQRDEVAELMTVMSLIRASALAPHESLDMIGRIRSEFDEQQ